MPKWIVKYLRKKFLKENSAKNYFNKIYIDRSDSINRHCKLINNNKVKEFLRLQGFRILKLTKLSFKQQIEIFSNAKIIVAPHGAGLANIVFCKKNTKIIEIKPRNHPNKVYETISKINKLNYFLIKLKYVKNNIKGDMFLKKEILKKILKF